MSDPLYEHFRLTKLQKRALDKMRVSTVRDLLYHFPHRYENFAAAKYIKDIKPNEDVSVFGRVSSVQKRLSWKNKKYIVEASLEDHSGSLKLIWFNQVYMEKILQNNPVLKATGKVSGGKHLSMVNPSLDFLPAMPEFLDENTNEELMPVYHESAGITSRWIYFAVRKILQTIPSSELQDPIPEKIRKKYNLPKLSSAIFWVHMPQNKKQASAAGKRFAFEEVFILQLAKQQEKEQLKAENAVNIQTDKEAEKKLKNFVSNFGFELTDAQKRALEDIKDDFKKPYPVARLLEGDVGSGKTAVAASAAYLVYNSKTPDNKYKSLQTAYMAPTEILAGQIFHDFIKFFAQQQIRIGLVTGSSCKIYPSKTSDGPTKIACSQLKKWIKEGIIAVVVGTHSLIFKSVEFENLAFVIVDEQHRFGTKQRAKLSRKDGASPYLLSMSATPIPRTLALTIYGDLELSVLDELPAGRKDITTRLVPKRSRDGVYEFVKRKLKEGRQAYIICPRIEEPDPEKANALRAKSVEEELKRLSEGPFADYRLAPLHGKMTQKEKDETMERFASHEIDILVATSVVEVGVNVPNATSIIIEGAERFGLSQLHQLRGRVRRAEHEAFCFLFTESSSQKTRERLKALTQSKDGFTLAEEDLRLRGPGDLYGSKQWGLSDIGMKALQNIKMVEAARKEAEQLIHSDPNLSSNSVLAEKLAEHKNTLHLE